MDKYKALIGLEMHCEISETNTKVFSASANSYTDLANSNISPLDMAFPGTLPVVNKEAVKKSLMASMILGCGQPEYMYFERKNYYYPDLPKGFQITQETKPAPVGIYGKLEYECNGETKVALINNLHLEEDSAATTHYDNYSTINYNRSGVPLLELVTEPCFHSSDEAVSFLETMRSIYQYAGISEADSKKGQVRCDVNVSLMDVDKDDSDPNNWGTKIEIKNVNSFSAVRDAINYEINRQMEAKENGTYDEMEQQTRRWDEESGTTIYMRSKADAIDYKYFVEPNIPKFKLSSEWLEEIRASIPELAHQRKDKYMNQLGLSEFDSKILVKEKSVSDYFECILDNGIDAKTAANWVTSILLGNLNKLEKDIKDISLTPKMLSDLIHKVTKGEISIKQGKEVLLKSLEENLDPNKVIEELGIKQIGSAEEIQAIVLEVLSENPDAKEKYNSGRTNIIDFLVGQVMKKTRGKANPSITYDTLKKELEG
ncbi:MAG: Asp-tRNA(Asn)/Glu-tRNA(Gln) amidotransferase subunit GatB [Bacilli bacterium]|nr:Asp-tRNA(Asn)/Glu-tRNA(Gln) amidotransferase subunit GatB [Bacilli bacterium]